MLNLQEKKTVAMLPASFTNAATASLLVDTLGFNACSIDIILGNPNTATNVPNVITIKTADVTNASSFVNMTASGALNYGSGTSNTTVTANGATGFTSTYTSGQTSTGTAAPDILTADITLVGGKDRYLLVQVSPVTTQVIAIEANLYRGGIAPSTAPSKNVVAWLTL